MSDVTLRPMRSKKLLEKYGPMVKKACSNPGNLNKLLNYIQRYIDKNNSALFAQGPLDKILFSQEDQNIFVEFVGGSEPEFTRDFNITLKEIYEKSEYKWVLAVHRLKFSFSFLTIIVARELYLMNKRASAELVLMYLTIKNYSALVHKYFPLGVKREAMLYTIQTLSNRYKYSKLQNNFEVAKDTTLGAIETYKKEYMAFDDSLYPNLSNQLFNRLNNNLQLISKNYYDNNANRRYLNTVKDSDDETNSQMDTREDSSGIINSLAEAATNNFMTKMPNIVIIKDLARQSDISYASLLQCLEECRKKHSPERINKLFNAIITLVYDSNHTVLSRIRSKEFIVIARRQISVATSNNPALKIVKEESDFILNQYCMKFAQSGRAATKTSYRQALYYYMVYIIVGSKG